MKRTHKLDDKFRIRLTNCIIDCQLEENLRVVFFEDYYIVCGQSKFDEMVAKIASNYEGSEDEVREILESRTVTYITDPQGRFCLPTEYRKDNFIEKECVAIGVSKNSDGSQGGYIKVYSKSIYENLTKGKIKKFESFLKGEGNEERRRED